MSVLRLRGEIVGPTLALLLFASTGWIAPGPTLAEEPPAGLDGVVAVATDGYHALALRADGTVWGWGTNSDWELGATIPTGGIFTQSPIQAVGLDQVRGIAMGYGHGLAVRADGTVWSWGQNDHGQVGVPQGENCPYHSRPCIQAPVPVPGLRDVKAVAATDNSSFALKADGTVWSWGEGRFGQLGLGTATDIQAPTWVEGLADVARISAVGTRVLALQADGTVWGWGGNDGRASPRQVPGLDGVVAVAAGPVRHVALKADGSVWAWDEPRNAAPAPVAGLGPMTAIAGGGLMSGAVAVDGSVWVWGSIFGGSSPEPPTQVQDLSNVIAIASTVSGEYNLALQADGTVWVWNQRGKPTQVPAPAVGTPTP